MHENTKEIVKKLFSDPHIKSKFPSTITQDGAFFKKLICEKKRAE